MTRTLRPRRTSLTVPASNPKMMTKARGLPADEIILDLEDSCAPAAKPQARLNAVAELAHGTSDHQIRAVRVNDWTTPWTYRDVIDIVSAAGAHLHAIVLPKVSTAAHVVALDLLLSQIERDHGLPLGRIGIEAQIEDAAGLLHITDIATSSPRLEAIIFGPGDFAASINMKSLTIGAQPPGYPADAFHHIRMSVLLACRAHGIQAVDGPWAQIYDLDGLRRTTCEVAALGFDGRWVLHPDQISPVNDLFTPSQPDYDRAENILDAYDWHTSEAGGTRGAIMLGNEMIDEASRKLAIVLAGKGRAAGLTRQDIWTAAHQDGALATH
ncbi:HpcH/HpaI aldolase/citrate lyase family protein [Mycolicibacterium goodii]|uniref:HpcH/HpaI aldolase/citrate lyase family protein n=1 Tax=Mycolicibacterium goodii TaxID=134601 RepID=UPI001BDD6B8A|nr:CoA ester lyase [Mycolicibacterium goodii]MBU8828908.1 CoA ester lyase [Mycolicibacterium goodii]